MKLELHNLEHRYPTGDQAVDGVTLTIEGTEPVAIIGQNGAGKTTLVKHFNGILRPTAGTIAVDGVDIERHTTAQWSKQVGYVFQNPDDQIFLETVRKEFAFGPTHIGMTDDDVAARTEWVAQLVGLDKKLDRHPFDLTPTEKKFCTIGSIIMMDPQAIVFDEPTCGQDKAGNTRLEDILAELKNRGKLCLTISHDMKFVTKNFSRVIVMNKGKVLLDGPTDAVFAQPDILAQSFVSPPPITRVAQRLGLHGTPFTVESFLQFFEDERKRVTHG